jgi:light-regulated signal transduction histidine kinase (bacteriophytochrome)
MVTANLEVAIYESGAHRDQSLPKVVADERQMEQLFQNLVANAIKFRGEAAPVVRVSARRFDDLTATGLHGDGNGPPGWMFSVSDNGIGIDPQFANKIFLIFQRLHHRNEYPGTGIGLALCKKIVERHGGHISVDSLPGNGATFRFTIPDKINGQSPHAVVGEETREACLTNQVEPV